MLKSSLCDYSDGYMLGKGNCKSWKKNISAALTIERNNKQVTFQNCVPFTDCIRKIKLNKLDNAEDQDVVNANLWSKRVQQLKNRESMAVPDPSFIITDSESLKFKSRLNLILIMQALQM